MKNNQTTVLGAGSWGTAIAAVLAEKGFTTSLWGHREEHIHNLISDGRNERYLPDYLFNTNIRPTLSLQDAVAGSNILCMVVPSQGYRAVFKKVLSLIDQDCIVVSASKGIENESLATMMQIMEEELEKSEISKSIQTAVLTGPSFAKEVVGKTPTAVTIGSKNKKVADELQSLFFSDYFRVYTSEDTIGLELSGAYKNIIAIATGICDGLGYGLNTRAALITRGLAEITRLGIHLGADPLTFSGLSGMGDLILTCTGDLSRNRTVGLQLGKGKDLQSILKDMGMVAEGVKTTQSGYKLAQSCGVEMPIVEQVYRILYESKSCRKAVEDLLSRDKKRE